MQPEWSTLLSFADPQTITITGVTTSLPRTSVGDAKSSYLSADGLIGLSAASAYGRRTRRTLRVDHSKITSDPFLPAQNVKVGASVYLVVDHPVVGYSIAELLALYTGFKTQMAATSDVLVSKLLGGES